MEPADLSRVEKIVMIAACLPIIAVGLLFLFA
jgi:hypothetical protein